MRHILLIESRRENQLMYNLNLQLYLGAHVVTKASLRDSVPYLKDHSDKIDLIVSRTANKDKAFEVKSWLDRANLEIPLVAVGDVDRSGKIIVDPAIQLRNVIKSIAEKFGITAEEMAAQSVGEFFPIPTEYFCCGLSSNCPIFFRDRDGMYNPLLKEGEGLTIKKIEMIKKQQYENLYIPSAMRLKFADEVNIQLANRLKSAKTDKEKIDYTEQGLNLVHSQARALGISDATLELADDCIHQMKLFSSKVPSLALLVNSLFKNELSYKYRHSHLTTYIALHMLEQMEWATEDQKSKLAMASFFQDIALPNDEMAKIKEDDEIDENLFTEKECMTIKNHAYLAHELLSQYQQVPLNVLTIIKQHHGVPMGNSLSDVSGSVIPLAALFILAQHLAGVYLQYENSSIKLSKEKVLKLIKLKYFHNVYKRFYAALDTMQF